MSDEPEEFPGQINEDGTITVVASVTFAVTDATKVAAPLAHDWEEADGSITMSVPRPPAAVVHALKNLIEDADWVRLGLEIRGGRVSVYDDAMPVQPPPPGEWARFRLSDAAPEGMHATGVSRLPTGLDHAQSGRRRPDRDGRNLPEPDAETPDRAIQTGLLADSSHPFAAPHGDDRKATAPIGCARQPRSGRSP